MIEQLLPPDCRIEDRNGTPVLVSQRFDDIYFSADDGLAETQLVFLDLAVPSKSWLKKSKITWTRRPKGSLATL